MTRFIRQESRKIVTAVMNQITYSEYLPLVLGPKYMKAFGLDMKRGYWDGKSDLRTSTRVFCHVHVYLMGSDSKSETESSL